MEGVRELVAVVGRKLAELKQAIEIVRDAAGV
jgi:hypothetical protein